MVGPPRGAFTAIEHTEQLVVPVLTIYEVIKKLSRESGDEVASAALSLMQRGHIVPVDLPLSMRGVVNGLPAATGPRAAGGVLFSTS